MKKTPTLTDEEREKLHSKYLPTFLDLAALDLQIDLALDHDAARKAGNSGSWSLYVQNWLNREVERQPRNYNGQTKRPTDPALKGL